MKRHTLRISLLALLLAPALAGATSLPPISQQEVGGGLRVFAVETHEVPLVAVRLLVPAGSALDDTGAEGIANLTGQLLLKGAGARDAEQVAEAIEQVGGSLSVRTQRDFTAIEGRFLAQDLDRALEILADALLAPRFAEEELAREKALVLAEISAVKEEPAVLADREFLRALIGEHPYAHPVDGDAAALAVIDRARVVDFHRRHYLPSGALLAIVGDVPAAEALALAERRFGAWRATGETPVTPPLEPAHRAGRRVLVIDKPDLTQSQIRIGNLAAARGDVDDDPLEVSNTLLGGGFTSRLVAEIRVNRGLTYGVRSRVAQMLRGGTFSVATFTDNRTLRETIDVALAELTRIREEPIPPEELDNWKRYMTGLHPFGLETTAQLAGGITDLTFYGQPLSHLTDYAERVRAVTPEACQAVARRHYWSDEAFILVVTNYAETRDQLAGLGEIEIVPLDALE